MGVFLALLFTYDVLEWFSLNLYRPAFFFVYWGWLNKPKPQRISWQKQCIGRLFDEWRSPYKGKAHVSPHKSRKRLCLGVFSNGHSSRISDRHSWNHSSDWKQSHTCFWNNCSGYLLILKKKRKNFASITFNVIYSISQLTYAYM